ncbi:MAG: hypothetical protein V4772_21355, partial [Pseudomonadota bacterium]
AVTRKGPAQGGKAGCSHQTVTAHTNFKQALQALAMLFIACPGKPDVKLVEKQTNGRSADKKPLLPCNTSFGTICP